jgi:hypothetical protein
MGASMKYFYALMLWLTEFELAITRSTGRNPENIRRLTQDYNRWLCEVQLCEIRRMV